MLRKLLYVLAPVAVVAAVGGVKWVLGNQDPVVQAKENALPSPNARDFYIRAGSRIRGEKALFGESAPSKKLKRKLVGENTDVLATARTGLKYRYGSPILDIDRAWEPIEHLAWLFELQGDVLADGGDCAGAIGCAIDAIKLGQDLEKGSNPMDAFTGPECENRALRGAWERVSHLSAPQARGLSRRLEDVMAHGYSLADVLRAERTANLRMFADWLREPGWSQQLAQSASYDYSHQSAGATSAKRGVSPPPSALWLRLAVQWCGKRRIYDNHVTLLDLQISAAGKPYSMDPEPVAPSDPYHDYEETVFQAIRAKHEKPVAMNRLLLAELALQAYRAEHGSYPDALAALVPGYLREAPVDPFGGGNPIRYRLTRAGFLLYSLGPDCKDDGGKPAENGYSKTAPDKYFVLEDSKGDIVAGVSR